MPPAACHNTHDTHDTYDTRTWVQPVLVQRVHVTCVRPGPAGRQQPAGSGVCWLKLSLQPHQQQCCQIHAKGYRRKDCVGCSVEHVGRSSAQDQPAACGPREAAVAIGTAEVVQNRFGTHAWSTANGVQHSMLTGGSPGPTPGWHSRADWWVGEQRGHGHTYARGLTQPLPTPLSPRRVRPSRPHRTRPASKADPKRPTCPCAPAGQMCHVQRPVHSTLPHLLPPPFTIDLVDLQTLCVLLPHDPHLPPPPPTFPHPPPPSPTFPHPPQPTPATVHHPTCPCAPSGWVWRAAL